MVYTWQSFFAGGAIGSSTGGWAYATGGWKAALLIGIALPTIAMIYYATEKKIIELRSIVEKDDSAT
ncbi:hypothetical protein GCM10020331_002130 [Ectobacillus funiculus]